MLVKKGKGSPYSITERRVSELNSVLGSQPAGDVSHKPGGRLPLLVLVSHRIFSARQFCARSPAAPGGNCHHPLPSAPPPVSYATRWRRCRRGHLRVDALSTPAFHDLPPHAADSSGERCVVCTCRARGRSSCCSPRPAPCCMRSSERCTPVSLNSHQIATAGVLQFGRPRSVGRWTP